MDILKKLGGFLFLYARKATVAFVGAAAAGGVSGVTVALSDGKITQDEAQQIIVASLALGVAAAFAVFKATNKPAEPKPAPVA